MALIVLHLRLNGSSYRFGPKTESGVCLMSHLMTTRFILLRYNDKSKNHFLKLQTNRAGRTNTLKERTVSLAGK